MSRKLLWVVVVATWLCLAPMYVRSFFVCDMVGIRRSYGQPLFHWVHRGVSVLGSFGYAWEGRNYERHDERNINKFSYVHLPVGTVLWDTLYLRRTVDTMGWRFDQIGFLIINETTVAYADNPRALDTIVGFGPPVMKLHVRVLMIPYWLPLFITALIGIRMSLLGVRRRRRLRDNRCVYCGYDLRATPNKCPECGSRAKKGTEAEKGPGSGKRATAD
jgi:hypothetical protein